MIQQRAVTYWVDIIPWPVGSKPGAQHVAWVLESAYHSPPSCRRGAVRETQGCVGLGITTAFWVWAPVCAGSCQGLGSRVWGLPHLATGWLLTCLCFCLRTEEDVAWTATAPDTRYTDIILYTAGSLALVVLLLLASLYRGQVLHGRHARQPATVQKLSRFPLARQVACHAYLRVPS